MIVLGYDDYSTGNNLKLFDDDAFNALDTGFIFLFSGSMFLSNITEYWMDVYSWFRAPQTRRGGGLLSQSACCL